MMKLVKQRAIKDIVMTMNQLVRCFLKTTYSTTVTGKATLKQFYKEIYPTRELFINSTTTLSSLGQTL